MSHKDAIDDGIRELLRSESLDQFETLLLEREWDEVPLWSRIQRLDFLSGLSALEQSDVLTNAAMAHLEKIYRWLAEHPQHRETCVILSITCWENLADEDPMPVVPCFWISTQPLIDMRNIHFRLGQSEQAAMTTRWVANQVERYLVLENKEPESENSIGRIYLAPRVPISRNITDISRLILGS